MKKLILVSLLLGALGFAGYRVLFVQSNDNSSSFGRKETERHGFSINDSNSQWVVVNKKRPLKPESYTPSLVIPEIPLRANITAEEKQVSQLIDTALKNMIDEAALQGQQLDLQSGYRSYDFQKKLYDDYASNDEQSSLDNYSAKPGYSEHQTGLAVDLGSASNPECNVKPCFNTTPESKWLAENAHNYGFIIRYPESKQEITGYAYEPWHLRYVGIYLATKMKSENIQTLEEYFTH